MGSVVERTTELLGTVITTPVVFVFWRAVSEVSVYICTLSPATQRSSLVVLVHHSVFADFVAAGIAQRRTLRSLNGETPFQNSIGHAAFRD